LWFNDHVSPSLCRAVSFYGIPSIVSNIAAENSLGAIFVAFKYFTQESFVLENGNIIRPNC